MTFKFISKVGRLSFPLLLVFFASSFGNLQAQNMNTNPNELRVIFLSELPEGITYYDQGFGDFIREKKLIPVIDTSIAETTKTSINREFASQGLNILFVDAPRDFIQARADIVKPQPRKFFSPSVAEKMAPLLSNLKSQELADIVIIVSPGKTSSERFLEGLAVMTKIGMFGIDKATYIFTMPRVEIYSLTSISLCTQLNPVTRKKIPAIYSDWTIDMANGPDEKTRSEMQAIVLAEMSNLISTSMSQTSAEWSKCAGAR
ncbi:hypothetical protein [Undibacterium flavidum]|uniref:Uncharacterized protein n=1 Tax=Undibacterium flavidum TaxID=2762297 RepID=A0ABR6YD22_9BURK|nr:hypothetical protein [Undibacterium flavidum]MBC3874428.1 hypothetical protein [Undibacterium flavidum]